MQDKIIWFAALPSRWRVQSAAEVRKYSTQTGVRDAFICLTAPTWRSLSHRAHRPQLAQRRQPTMCDVQSDTYSPSHNLDEAPRGRRWRGPWRTQPTPWSSHSPGGSARPPPLPLLSPPPRMIQPPSARDPGAPPPVAHDRPHGRATRPGMPPPSSSHLPILLAGVCEGSRWSTATLTESCFSIFIGADDRCGFACISPAAPSPDQSALHRAEGQPSPRAQSHPPSPSPPPIHGSG